MDSWVIILVVVLLLVAAWWWYTNQPCVRCQKDPSGWIYVQSKTPSGEWNGGPAWKKGMYCLKADGSSRVPWGGPSCMSASTMAECNQKIANVKCPPVAK